jgi:hypothetical protein
LDCPTRIRRLAPLLIMKMARSIIYTSTAQVDGPPRRVARRRA